MTWQEFVDKVEKELERNKIDREIHIGWIDVTPGTIALDVGKCGETLVIETED